MKFIKTLWQFSRPHTIIGSFCSITALFAIALKTAQIKDSLPWQLYVLTLISALTCNVFIVGLNQYEDVDIDRINKPYLPIAAGNLSKQKALIIILSCLVISLVIAASLNWILFLLILTINAIGAAYSLPPIQLKRHHRGAALCITVVRGVLVNLGMTMHFIYALTGQYQLPNHIFPLTIFVIGFSFGIAWFKDIPDTEGDAKFNIKTLALSLSKKAAFNWGVAIVTLSYAVLLISPFAIYMPINKPFYFIAQLSGLSIFIIAALKLDLNNPAAIKRFYLLFWGLFFLQYIVYPISYFI